MNTYRTNTYRTFVTYFIVDCTGEDGASVGSTVAIHSAMKRLAQCQASGQNEESQGTRQPLPQVRRLRLHIRHQASAR